MGWGELFSLASAMVWALAVILLRRSGDTLPALELNLFKNLLGFLLMIPTILVFDGAGPPGLTGRELAIVVSSGLIGIALADTLYLKALNLMGASRTGIVASLFSPFVVLLSFLFLGEWMSSWQWAGFVLVLCGVLVVTWRVRRSVHAAEDIRKGAVVGALSMLMMALGVVMVKEILEERSFLWTVEIRLAGGVIGILAYIGLTKRWRRTVNAFKKPHPWRTVVLGSFLASYVSMILWLAGYRLIDASVASILNETNCAFIVILAWLMLGERIGLRKLLGVCLTISGVAVMMLN